LLDVQARLERERAAFEDSILTLSTDTAAAQAERGRAAAADRHAPALQSGDVAALERPRTAAIPGAKGGTRTLDPGFMSALVGSR
jgi:hypothetical protein